jgi:hypothetical protein
LSQVHQVERLSPVNPANLRYEISLNSSYFTAFTPLTFPDIVQYIRHKRRWQVPPKGETHLLVTGESLVI